MLHYFIFISLLKVDCIIITIDNDSQAKCGRGFTRRTSGKRHNLNSHSGMSKIVESSLYYIGIIQGRYPTPDPQTPFKQCYIIIQIEIILAI